MFVFLVFSSFVRILTACFTLSAIKRENQLSELATKLYNLFGPYLWLPHFVSSNQLESAAWAYKYALETSVFIHWAFFTHNRRTKVGNQEDSCIYLIQSACNKFLWSFHTLGHLKQWIASKKIGSFLNKMLSVNGL